MKPDLNTILLLLVIFNVLQVIAFVLNYLTDRARRGSREWILWSLCFTAGFLLIFLRRSIPPPFTRLAVALSNAFLFGGYLFLYVGIERFLEIRPRKAFIVSVTAFFAVGSVVANAVLVDGNLSATVLYLSLACVILFMAVPLWRRSLSCIRVSARFFATLLFVQAVYLVARSVLAYTAVSNLAFFESSAPQIALFLVPLCMGYLWSVSIVIMLNHAKANEYREARANQELIFNTHPDAVWITNLTDERIEDVNDGFTRITGFGRKDAIGKTTAELGFWKDCGDRAQAIRTVRERGSFEDLEASFLTKAGEPKRGIVSSRIIALRGQAMLVSAMHDITARIEMEAALKASEEKFRLLIENSYDVMYTLDPSGVITFVSPVWKRLLGHEVSEVVGRPFRDFVHPDDLAACKEFLTTMAETRERQVGVEYRVLHRNGYWLWHTSSAVPFFAESGTLRGFYGIARDITERREFQKELELQATTDELTGLTNRRRFLSLAQAELKRAQRMNRALSLALIDIDHFKEINDTWGHGVGDQALRTFASIIQGHIREMDILSRFGGDEFVILFPETDSSRASVVLERLQEALARTPFEAVKPPAFLSVSAGLTSLVEASRDGIDTLDAILGRADKALYAAKEAGRKRFSVL